MGRLRNRKATKYQSTPEESDEDDVESNLLGEQLIQDLRHHVIVRFGSAGLEWPVPREPLCRESEYFRDVLQDSKETHVTISFLGAPVLELYIQWLYFDRYNEYPEYAATPSYHVACTTHTLDPLSQQELIKKGIDGIVWTVKAGVLAWKLGHNLQAPRFQNYAMRRLFAAYSRTGPTFKITGDFFRWTRDLGCCLGDFFEDLVIRNWGDHGMIDHDHVSWDQVFKECDKFLQRFYKSMADSPNERAVTLLAVEKYLVVEE